MTDKLQLTGVSWWLRPSKLPKAPPWWVVFTFGAVWNAGIERSWWGTLFCLALIPISWVIDRVDRLFWRHAFDGRYSYERKERHGQEEQG